MEVYIGGGGKTGKKIVKTRVGGVSERMWGNRNPKRRNQKSQEVSNDSLGKATRRNHKKRTAEEKTKGRIGF